MSERRGFFDPDPEDSSGQDASGRRGSFPERDRPRDTVRPSRRRPAVQGRARAREDSETADAVEAEDAVEAVDRTVTLPGAGPRNTPRGSASQKTGRSFRRWIGVLIWWGVQAALAAVVGVLVFDRVLMPRFVEQGAEVEVPRVHGVFVSEALEILEQAGLEPVISEGRFSQIADDGTILESSPGPGLLVKLGRKVFLTPSLGTESRVVPNLRSLSLRLASTRLEVAGLKVGLVDYTATDEVPPGVVLASTPSPGSPVRGAGKVSLLMSRARRAVPFWMPHLEGRAGIETAAWLEACGFQVDLVESSFPGEPGEVLRHEPRPGEPIYSGDRVELVVAGNDDDGFGRDRDSFRDR